ncbi:GrpB family protein [Virgibacillus dokdonensis]|uniref:Dephospho-CoA kinase/protein folding accessory domain-containing protein n=1 Tax=Virgibacillus dokdonensis TaxID=302167 RepID=A0A2K9IUL2_9BACI|nr:GrpB family protein [Virgibacillus dokdonensis]AUJ23447.1 dephospho-CoA kinase/protein folding accessory domain-containing protein [Virgibacillus dokdonensis]
MREVVVIPYQSQWQQLFGQEATYIKELFQTELVTIHHIGSTAVPDLAAKPIIDIMPVVKSIEEVGEYIEGMENLGYHALGEYGIEGRRFFIKGEYKRTHHVHMFQQGDQHIKRHIAFRDYLIHHPSTAIEYGNLKLTLAKNYPNQMEKYMSGKNDFVKDVEQRALSWYKQ